MSGAGYILIWVAHEETILIIAPTIGNVGHLEIVITAVAGGMKSE